MDKYVAQLQEDTGASPKAIVEAAEEQGISFLPPVGTNDKDKYLHTNAETGEVEWSEVSSGGFLVTVTGTDSSGSISYSCDKTYDEIAAAIDAGERVSLMLKVGGKERFATSIAKEGSMFTSHIWALVPVDGDNNYATIYISLFGSTSVTEGKYQPSIVDRGKLEIATDTTNYAGYLSYKNVIISPATTYDIGSVPNGLLLDVKFSTTLSSYPYTKFVYESTSTAVFQKDDTPGSESASVSGTAIYTDGTNVYLVTFYVDFYNQNNNTHTVKTLTAT